MRKRGGWQWRGWWARQFATALVAVVSLLGILMAGSLDGVRAQARDNTPVLSIVLPQPSSDTADGPVGTNVAINGQGTPNDTYQLGYALRGATCADGYIAFDGNLRVTADGGGDLATQFAWPGNAGNGGTSYIICAKDSTTPTNPPIASQQFFRVDSASKPRIELAVPPATPPIPGGKFTTGGRVAITGKYFYGEQQQFYVFLTASATFSPGDYKPDNALKTADGNPITTQGNGGFTATVVLPQVAGDLYLYVVSADGTDKLIPSLVASKSIKIEQVATPTATATIPAPTPSPTVASLPTPTPTPSTSNTLVPVFGLGGLSLVLFIAGLVLIFSAASTPRPRP